MGEVIVQSGEIVFAAAVDQKTKQHRIWPLELVFESASYRNHPKFGKWLVGEVLVDSQGVVRADFAIA